MKYKIYTNKEFSLLLKSNGFVLEGNTSGARKKYIREINGKKEVLICSSKNPNPMICKRLIKEYNLI